MSTYNPNTGKLSKILQILSLLILMSIAGFVLAVPVNIGDVISDSIDTISEVDEFEFTASSGDELFFDVQSGSLFSFYWELTAPSDLAVFDNTTFADKGPIVLSETGQYRLKVSSRQNRTGAYQLQIVSVPGLSSTAINLNETIEGEISVQGEKDEFTFTLATEKNLYFDKLTGNTSTNWTLTDANNNVGFNSFFSDIQATVFPAGDYRLTIDGNGDDTFAYSFIIAEVPPVSRTQIEVNDVVTGEIAVQGEIDEFTISLESTKQLFFDRQIGNIAGIAWTLTDENQQIIFTNDFWNDVEFIVLDAGDYILSLDGRNDIRLDYQFQIAEIPPVSSTVISLNDIVQANIAVQGEEDEFTFSVAAAQEVYFDRQLGSLSSISWLLKNRAGEEIFNVPNWIDVEPIVLEAGEYTLRIDGVGDDRPEYQFQLHIVPETTTTEANLYLGNIGKLTVPGQRQRFEFSLGEATLLGIERLTGSSGSIYSWRLFNANNSVLASDSSFFSTPAEKLITIPESGTYTLEFDGNRDFIGQFNFRLWKVDQTQPEIITLDSIVSLRLSSQGQIREYQFEAVEGEPLYLNLDYRISPRIWLNLFAPDGRRLLANRSDDSIVASLPETGTYKLIASNSTSSGAVPSGNHSFTLSQTNDDFIAEDAAELQITSANANFVATDDPASIEITYTVTNNGSVATNVSNWKDRIQFYTENEFRLAAGGVTTPFDFTIPIEVEHSGVLASGDSYTNTVTIDYPLLDQTSESFDILIDADVENQVYEATSDLNQYSIEPAALFYDERLTTGSGAISTNIQDGSLLPSNTPIVLSGNANLSGGTVNLYFIMDTSASTSTPFGFDANGDGTVDELDDFNGDGRDGDVLDVEIGSIITIANQVQQTADDALVSIIPFNDIASILDLGPGRLLQPFIKPNEQSYSESDSNLAYALKSNTPRLFGTNFAAPISKVLDMVSIAPPSDQNLVFFLTDGQALDNASTEELQALAEFGITFFAFQINNNNITSSLQMIIDEINNHTNSIATGQSVVNPGDLPSLVLQSLELASVEINGIEVDAIDAAGNYFSSVTLNEGPNLFTIAALDSEGNSIEKQITLIGAPSDGGDSSSLVASQGQLMFSNAYFNRSTKRFFADARLQNNSAFPIINPVSVNLQIDPVAVNLDNADGQSTNGQAIVIFDDELGAGVNTGDTSASRKMIFSNQRQDRFSVHSLPLTTANTAPYFASTPVVTINEGQAYAYDAIALDDDGDTLIYSLKLAPQGMNIDGQTGQITWDPTLAQTGTHYVSLLVVDGNGGVAEQGFQLSITTAVANLPPFISSTPELSSISTIGYEYQVIAVDPEADTLAYSLNTAPAGVSINPSTGLLLAAPGALSGGSVEFTVSVVDTQGGQAQQSWILTVKDENQAPVIVSTPVESTSAETNYSYVLQVIDDDPALQFELTTAPLGMGINSVTGVVSMFPNSGQIGSHDVSIKVTDPFGASVLQNYTLTISEDAEVPQVSIVLNPAQIALGESTIVTVLASDNAGISDITLSLNGVEQTLNSNNSAIITPSSAGVFTLTARVIDINNLVSQETSVLRVIDTNDVIPPVVAVESPEPRSSATFLTDIVGSVQADDLLSYKLQHALASEFDGTAIASEGPQWTTFAQGNQQVDSALLGVFDPSILRNDDYVVRLLAEDVNGNTSAAAIYIGVSGEAKIGVFQLTYTDLAIPVSNIPIEINRVYRTTDAAVDGDLGYGWHLQLSNPDIKETVPVASLEETLGIFVNNAYTATTRVYLNAPDGRRIGFTFEPEPVATLFGNSFIPKFTPDPGVYYQLEVDPVTISQKQDGSFVLFLISFNYNPQDFRLIEPNGTTWQYNQFSGLEKVSDRNGNELVYTNDGIFHSSGVAVTFERDDEGRITSITDPDGNQLGYIYNSKGELIAFTNRTGEVESYAYFDTPQHFINQITDTNGNVTAIEFDQDGRLAASINGLGERITQDWDPTGFSGTITDAKGQITLLNYDLRGNVISEQDPDGGTITYSYDENNNVLSVTDKNGNKTTNTYDDLGNAVSETNAFGDTTQYGFDEFANRTSVTNALGEVSSSTYDENGNLRQVNMPDGSHIEYIYDEEGRLVSVTDAEGNQTTYEYSGSFTTPIKINLADGNSQLRTLNKMGLVISLTDEIGNTVTLTRDANGRIIEQIDSDNQKYVYEYSDNVLISITDPSGKSKYFDYDAKEQLESTSFDDGTQILYSYDANGNMTSVTDAGGNKTSYTYDALDRRISRADATGATETYQYDAVGNLTGKTDRRGYTVNYAYDGLNRMVSETWLDDDDNEIWQLNKTYDAIGNVIGMDDGNSVITNSYDANNRVISHDVSISSGPDSALTLKYDGNDRLIEVSDSSSLQKISYNSRNLVDQVSLSADSLDLSAELGYDPRGLRASMKRKLNENELGTTTYVFNSRYLAQSIDHQLNNAAYSFEYVWDDNRRVSSQQQNSETIEYVYDQRDQLNAANRTELPDELYGFDSIGNPILDSDVGAANRLLSSGDIEYTYDDAGNMVNRQDNGSGERTEFTYDHRNRLVSIKLFDGSDAVISDISYQYDPLDRRIKRSVDNQDEYTNYVFEDAWTDTQVNGNVSRRYLNGALTDEKVARIVNGQAAWYLTDKQQTIYSIVDSDGNTVNEIEYDSFGQVISETSPNDADRFTHTGRELNRLIGVYDYRARTYDPLAKRFYSEDPIEFDANDANLYRYVFNNPLQGTDPTGESVAMEYGQILCQIVVPQVGHYKAIGSCLDDMYQGIADAVKTATSNDGLAGDFGKCVIQGVVGNALGYAGGHANAVGGAVGGAYNSMFPPGGAGDGSDGSPGDAAVALACAAF